MSVPTQNYKGANQLKRKQNFKEKVRETKEENI